MPFISSVMGDHRCRQVFAAALLRVLLTCPVVTFAERSRIAIEEPFVVAGVEIGSAPSRSRRPRRAGTGS